MLSYPYRRIIWLHLALALAVVAPAGNGQSKGSLQEPLDLELGPVQTIYDGGVFPYMFLARNGTTVVHGVRGWKRESVEGMPFTVRSTDGRKTWTEWKPPTEMGDGPIHEGSVVQLTSGTVLLFNWYVQRTTDGRLLGKMWRSTNHWETLTGPEEIRLSLPQAATDGFDDRGEPFSGIVFHRTVMELPSGDLVAGLYGRFKEDTFSTEYQPKQQKYRSFLMRSRDGGKSWSYVSTIAAGPVEQEGYPEPVIVRLTQGRHKGRLDMPHAQRKGESALSISFG